MKIKFLGELKSRLAGILDEVISEHKSRILVNTALSEEMENIVLREQRGLYNLTNL